MRRIGQKEIVKDIEDGKITREEAIDLAVEKSRVNLEIKRGKSSSGVKQFEEWAAAELGRIGALWAGHELKGNKIASEIEQQYVREFQEGAERVIEEYALRGDE